MKCLILRKVGCVFPMVGFSMLPQDALQHAPHFKIMQNPRKSSWPISVKRAFSFRRKFKHFWIIIFIAKVKSAGELSIVGSKSPFKNGNLGRKPIFLFSKVGCVFSMLVVSIKFHPEFGRNNHREAALHFMYFMFQKCLSFCLKENAFSMLIGRGNSRFCI